MMATPLESSCRSLPAPLSHSGFLPGFLLLLVGDQGRGGCELGPISFGCQTHPLLLKLLWGEMKGFTLLRAAALHCVNSNQELEEEEEDDEAGWVLSQKISPVFFSFQLFIKARCKGPDTRPAEPGCCDVCDTRAGNEGPSAERPIEQPVPRTASSRRDGGWISILTHPR